MHNKKNTLLGNAWFLTRYAFRINRKVYWSQIPMILVNAVTPFITILFYRFILNEITISKNVEKAMLYMVIMVVLLFLSTVFKSQCGRTLQRQIELTVNKIKRNLGLAVMQLEYSEVETPRVRDFVELAKNGANFSGILDAISTIISSTITLAGVITIILMIQPIVLLFAALVGLFQLLSDKMNQRLWGKYKDRFAFLFRKIHYYSRIMSAAEFGKEVRLNNLQKWIYQRSDVKMDERIALQTKYNFKLQCNGLPTTIVTVVEIIVILFFLVYKFYNDQFPIGDFTMYLTSVLTFTSCVSAITTSISSIMQTGLFANDFRYCIEEAQASTTQQNNITSAHPTALNKDEGAIIEFKNVSFKYPNTDRLILKNISLKIYNGESLSIVGANGAGKTTIVKLLCRLYKPTEGEILFNGVNIQTIEKEQYAQYIGAVFQDFKLFSFSVSENIAFDEELKSQKAWFCLEKSGLKQKIEQLPEGINTTINKEFDSNGIEFSGGEGQKLAMARTLYKDAPIIILDEPTAALDPIAEYEMYTKFDEITKGKTAIYISHRLSSCQFCDKIAVLEDGKIAQYGNHKELVMQSGPYAKMWNMQAKYYVG